MDHVDEEESSHNEIDPVGNTLHLTDGYPYQPSEEEGTKGQPKDSANNSDSFSTML